MVIKEVIKVRGKHDDFKVYMSAYQNTVTGSRHLLTINRPDQPNQHILMECGAFQGSPKEERLNYLLGKEIDPDNIDAAIVSHVHNDHIGNVPALVAMGYNNPIYMTDISKELTPVIMYDSVKHQSETAGKVRKAYPEDARIIKPLYREGDVRKMLGLTIGLPYGKTVEILPGIKLTFFENAHILGAAFTLLQIECEGKENIDLYFSGDFRLKSCFQEVPPPPQWLKSRTLFMISESTYGNTDSSEIKKCFKQNLLDAFAKGMGVAMGTFAMARLQEVLYIMNEMDKAGEIPSDYYIYVVGKLGINITKLTKKILEKYYPEKADFISDRVLFIGPEDLGYINEDPHPIVLMTAGMLSHGPARELTPVFLENPNMMIHLAGYAAENTGARALLDGRKKESITFCGAKYTKMAEVMTTRELSAHPTADVIIDFINQFDHIEGLFFTHGELECEIGLQARAQEETSAKQVEVLNRENMYVIRQNTPKGASYTDISIKRLPTHFEPARDPEKKELEAEERRKARKAEKKEKRRLFKREKRARKK